MIRSVLAVVGGYATLMVGVMAFFAILMFSVPEIRQLDPSGPYDGPAWLLWAELGASLLIAPFGGYVCAWIAGRHEWAHGGALAGVMLLLGMVTIATEGGSKPWWSTVAVSTLPAAFAVLGAAVRARITGAR